MSKKLHLSRVVELLKKTTVGLICTEAVICVDPQMSLEECLARLSSHNITGAPVKDFQGTIIGFIDTLSLFSYLNHIGPVKLRDAMQLPLEALLEYSRKIHNIVIVPLDASLFDVSSSLSLSGLHTALVVDRKSDQVSICSQSDVIAFLASQLTADSDASKFLLEECERVELDSAFKRPNNDPVLASENTSVWEIANVMIDKGVPTVGLVGDEGKLLANFSIADLRTSGSLDTDSVTKAYGYLERHSVGSLIPVSVYRKCSLCTAILSAATNKVHGVWMVDEDGMPLGVITLADMLACVLKV